MMQRKISIEVLLWVILVVSSVIFPVINATAEDAELLDTKVSYIIEPFEDFGGGIWSFSDSSAINITTSNDALYGDGSLAFLMMNGEANNETLKASWLAEHHPHNCFGASELSVAVKTDVAISIQVAILDDRECYYNNLFNTTEDCQTSVTILKSEVPLEASPEWYHLSASVADLLSENGLVDLKRMRGWTIQVGTTTNDTASSSGTVLVDQLACHGNGNLLGAAFHLLPFPNNNETSSSFAQAKQESMWLEEFFESQIARNTSINTLEDGVLTIDYLVQQVQSWGGFNDVAHLAAGNGYYNLSQATAIAMDYFVTKPASIPGRCIFRFVLQDGSHCVDDCDTKYHGQERWYSFNSIMDLQGSGNVVLPLQGSTDPITTFWFTGWSGIPGNKLLDLDHIKGYTIEVVLDSGLALYDYLNGTFELSNMSAVVLPQVDEEDKTCAGVLEEDLYFHEWAGSEFTRVEFMAATCCEVCQEDPDCIFAMSNNRDCFIASEADPNKIGLLANEVTAGFSSFWMDDPIKRGDWCGKCHCDESALVIDCKGQDLKILPKTINDDMSWEPRLIDLQDNYNLVLIGSGSLDEVGNSLEEIRFPSDLKFLSPGALDSLPKLKNVAFQGSYQDDVHRMVNAITSEADSFGDICCGFGPALEINWELTITTCDLKIDAPGIDAVYEPFYNYFDATILRAVSEDASFMREAAESVEKCAEFCAIDDDCNYFTYDQRLPNAEHKCLMYKNNGTIFDHVCCLDDHYADEERKIPGTISGRPPQSRHRDDNARVLISSKGLSLTESNNYATELTLSLGADPLRGAVWIYPKVTAGTSDLDFVVSPSHVPLYTANSTVKIFVSLENPPQAGSQSTTVLVELDVASCDEAFSVKENADDGLISLSVIPMELSDKESLTMSIVVPVIAVGVLCLAAFLWYDYKRRQNDMIWKVKEEELHFDSPPEVIGRGTFGLVLLAEYRGTAVAVKRVIPAKSRKSGTRSGGAGRGVSSIVSAMSFPDPSGLEPKYPSERVDDCTGMMSMSEREDGNFPRRESCEKDANSIYVNSRSLKITKFGNSNDKAAWKRLRKNFIQEMRQLSKLRHPCICTVMGAVIGKSIEPMLIMEYMDHGSLFDLLKNETVVIDGEVILPILRDISQGVRFLHSANPQVIHGDLKAANILVDRQFRAKVADFGLSQKKQLGGTGTPFWMAPELLRKEAANSSASDVFSFGVILIEVYSRKDPYEGESSKDILKEIADKVIQRRPIVPDNCPPQIRSMISDCLVDEAEMRPSFEEIDTRLKRIDAEAVDVKTRRSRANTTVSMFDIFPKKIAEALQEGRKVEAEHRDCVTIFFSDIVNFTSISSELDPRKVADMLDRLYTAFDALSNAYDIFKVETIGDAYMAVTNLVKDQPDDHVKLIAEFAIEAIEAANETLIDTEDPSKGYVNIRCGFHSGPVVADVVGNKNPRYCLFGDTVNSAHRMESNSKTNRIHCSRVSADLLKVQCPDMPLRSRGKILIKGKGEMQTYWVNDTRRPSLVPNNNPPVTGGKVFLNGMELALSQVEEGHETGRSEELFQEETKSIGHFSSSGDFSASEGTFS